MRLDFKLLSVILILLVSFSIQQGFSQGIEQQIRAKANEAGGGIAAWYQARNYAPAWDGQRLGGLASFIQELDAHGLSPELFRLSEWDQQWRNPSPDPSARAAVEVGTTQWHSTPFNHSPTVSLIPLRFTRSGPIFPAR